MLDHIADLLHTAGSITNLRRGRSLDKASGGSKAYDEELKKPVLKCSICNGEQVAGFKDIRSGKFEEVALIRNEKELDDFMRSYGIEEISKEY